MPSYATDDLDTVLMDRNDIADAVARIGAQIAEDYKGRTPVLVGVLKGAVFFLADLCRAVDLPIEIDTLAVSSYGASTRSSGVVRMLKDIDVDIVGRDVILVEDIVDTGRTLDYLLRTLRERGPASLRVCALLDKPSRREVALDVDYTGRQIPDVFVVGYGLDFAERYRNLPVLATLRREHSRAPDTGNADT